MKMKRIIAVLLCIAMMLSLSACAAPAFLGGIFTSGDSSNDVYVFPERTPVPFSEMRTDNYDADACNAALDEMELLCEKKGNLDKIKADYDIIVEQYDRLATDYAVANVLYMFDSSDDAAYELYSGLEQKLIALGDRILTVLSKVLTSSYADAMTTYINCENIILDAVDYVPMTDEEFALSEQRTELEDRYYDVAASSGRFSRTKAEDIYLELLDNFIASNEFNDSENYAVYIYDAGYGRDYTVEDIAVMKNWVKEFIVPYYFGVINAIIDSGLIDTYYDYSIDDETIIETVRPYVSSVSEEAAQTFDMMLEYGLIDIAASETKNDGGFTTSFEFYGVPFIYDCPYGYLGDMQTLIHEFGHYYETYHTMKPSMYDYGTIDVAEINSQGMEMLMVKYADEIYGEELGDISVLMNLYSILGAIIDGCIFDEFQQQALYGRMDGSITEGKQLTDLYLDIEYDYFEDIYYSWAEDWWQVHHTFTSPFYYISYATSATAALGFLMMANEDYDEAVKMYVELIDIGTENGFLETLEMIGMPLPTTEEGCAELSEGLADFLENEMGIEPLWFR